MPRAAGRVQGNSVPLSFLWYLAPGMDDGGGETQREGDRGSEGNREGGQKREERKRGGEQRERKGE